MTIRIQMSGQKGVRSIQDWDAVVLCTKRRNSRLAAMHVFLLRPLLSQCCLYCGDYHNRQACLAKDQPLSSQALRRRWHCGSVDDAGMTLVLFVHRPDMRFGCPRHDFHGLLRYL
jgi:hypothetical protein